MTRLRLKLGVCPGLIVLLLAGGVSAANLLDEICAQYPGRPHSWLEVVNTLKALDEASPRLSAYSVGLSHEGRQIPLAALYAPGTKFGETARLFIIARQHGSEKAGTEATMALIRHLVGTQNEPELNLLRRVTLIICPMVNPDGAERNRRRNAQGRDLNRDWAALSQPETRAIEAAVRMWRPHAFVDLHELPANSRKAAYKVNFVETLGPDAALSPALSGDCMFVARTLTFRANAYGFPLNAFFDDSSDNLALAHRHFGFRHGLYSFLLEAKTGGGRDMKHRMRFHLLGMLTIAAFLAGKVAAPSATASMPLEAQPPRAVSRRPARPSPAPAGPVEPVRTTVRLVSPAAGSEIAGDTVLRAEVTSSEEFSYVTFEIDGRVKALTNTAPFEYRLDWTDLAPGGHKVAVRAHNRSGTVLAQDEIPIRLRGETTQVAE